MILKVSIKSMACFPGTPEGLLIAATPVPEESSVADVGVA